MKVLLIVGVILASAASLWAQGQIITGSMSVEAVTIAQSVSLVSERELPLSSTLAPSDWLPPSQRAPSPSGDVSFTEVSCELITYMAPAIPVLAPTPTADSSSSLVPDVQSQSLSIQPVPEPSAFAFCGLVFGLVAIRRLSHSKVFAAALFRQRESSSQR
jgi:hypothetical protein